MKVCNLIIGLSKGGAETMLYNLLKFKQNDTLQYTVVSFGVGNDYFKPLIEKLGIEVLLLDIVHKPISSLYNAFLFIQKCDVLCCWMYHANFIGLFLGKLARNKKIIWNIRHSNLEYKYNKFLTLLINKVCAKLSFKIDLVAFNGDLAKQVHEACGYDRNKSIVMNNGVDVHKYRFISNGREILAREPIVNFEDKMIILSATKWTPIKDVENFIKAFSLLHKRKENVIAIMCGKEIGCNNKALLSLIDFYDLQVGKNIYLLGLRDDLPVLMSACDLYVLHSIAEAFPNTLLEAMACEANCVTTKVGVVDKILIDQAMIVPPENAFLLCEAMCRVLNGNTKNSKLNRKKIVECYSIENIVLEYENAFVEIVS